MMIVYEWLAAGVGCALADAVFHPLETLKNTARPMMELGRVAYFEANGSVWRAFWRPGFSATLVRALSFTGFRVGLYPTVKEGIGGDGVGPRLAAGLFTGAVGATVFNPIDLVRIRMQLAPHHYPVFDVLGGLRQIVAAEGPGALWRGASASIARNALLSACQLATYDTLKQHLKRTLDVQDGVPLHAATAFCSGCVTQTIVQPVDTIRTIAMREHDALKGGPRVPILRLARNFVAENGLIALYRGYGPALGRHGPVIMLQMPLTELIRSKLGLGYF